MKNSTSEYNATINVSTITKWMIGIGLSLLIIVNLVDANFINQYWWLVALLKVLETIGGALFSAGLVSVIVEISTIRNLVSDAFNRLLKDDFPIDNWDRERLKAIKKKIDARLVGISEERLGNSVYRYEENLEELASSKYYEYHNNTYHITPDSEHDCIHIKMKIDLRLVNRTTEDNVFRLKYKLYKVKENLSLEEFKAGIKFPKLKINDKDVDITDDIIKVVPVDHKAESKYYDYKVIIEKPLTGERNKVTAEICYDVPMYDICQSFKISLPTKNIEHKFYIYPDCSTKEKWVIRANAYSTFYHNQDDDRSNYKIEQEVDNSVRIIYKDWALVGNGYCVFYQKA